MSQLKLICIGVIVGSAAIASLLIQRRAQAQLQDNDAALRQQESQLTELATENERLSRRLSEAKQMAHTNANARAVTADPSRELAQLRAKVEALRQQTNQLSKQLAENRRQAGTQFYSQGDFNLLDHNREKGITFSGGPRGEGKANDARALTAGLRRYAGEHQGEFASNLDQIASYLPKPLAPDAPGWENAPLSGTNDFEIVFQGTQADLTNIPERRVALIRERQPWRTADGKWARVYGYADGAASTIESDDNFQSWDAQHIIPPLGANR